MNSAVRPTIGVFDSGFGGLTVLRALMHHLPGADYLYLGDTARLPYGSKSAETVTRYTAAAIDALYTRGAELIVIACNTASALALPTLHAQCPVPVVGVIQPGASAAAKALHRHNQCPVPALKPTTPASPTRDQCPVPAFNPTTPVSPVLVLATEATVASHAYAEACAAHGLHTIEKACPLLVPLAEEGWTDHPVTAQVLEIYLREAATTTAPGAILLGCTHYPLLRPLLDTVTQRLLGPVPIVDSAEATALHVRSLLPHAASTNAHDSQQNVCPTSDNETNSQNRMCPTSGFSDVGSPLPHTHSPNLQCFATDSTAKFQRLGQRFLARELDVVTLIDLDA